MAWSKQFTEELKAQADIRRIVSDYITLKKAGHNYVGRCPFHTEKDPSFNVNPQRQIFKCFGCGKGGDVFGFVMEIEGVPFPEAVKTVAEKCGIPIPEDQSDRETAARDRKRSELLEVNRWAADFFENQLNETAEGRRALSYLEKREVSRETQQVFKIGYAPDSWDALGSHLKRMGATRGEIESSGLVSLKESGGYYDRFRGRLMFPISDAQGRVIAFGGRIIGEGEPKYLNSPETALYTKGQHLFGLNLTRENIRRKSFAILVEGYLDLVIPYQHGIRNMVASLGTALTEQQARLLGRYSRRVVVNFDPDRAGAAAAGRSLETLLGEGFNVKVLTLPDNLDPDDFIRTRGPVVYYKHLKRSQPYLDFVVDQAVATHGITTPAGKVETINEILPYLKLVKDKIERAEHFARIADVLKIENRHVREEFKRAVETRSAQIGKAAKASSITIKRSERRLLDLVLNSASVRRQVTEQLIEEDYRNLRAAELFRIIIKIARRGEDPSYERLIAHQDELDQEIREDLIPSLLIGGEYPETEEDVTRLLREARGCLCSIRSDSLAERQTVLQHEINRAQRDGDEARLSQLFMERVSLAQQEKELAHSEL
jgi:DNA primase